MKMLFRMAAAVGLLIGASGAQASADMIFDLSGVTLQYGGTLTGSFTTNDALTTVISSHITASAGPGGGGFTFVGFDYNYPGTTIAASLPTQYVQFDSPGYELRLAVNPAHPLTAAGAVLSTNSYEYESVAGSRAVTGGQLIGHAAVPEPGALTLLMSAGGSILVGGAWRRRNRLVAASV